MFSLPVGVNRVNNYIILYYNILYYIIVYFLTYFSFNSGSILFHIAGKKVSSTLFHFAGKKDETDSKKKTGKDVATTK